MEYFLTPATNSPSSRHQLVGQQVSSILILSTSGPDCPLSPSDAVHHLQVPGHVYFCQWAKNHRFPQPLWWFNNLLEKLTELRKALGLCLVIYCNGYNSGTAKWKRCIEQGVAAEEARSFPVLFRQPLSGYLGMFTTQEVQVSSWTVFIELNLQQPLPCSLLRDLWPEISNPLIIESFRWPAPS